METISNLANSPIMWIFAIAIVSLVVVQSYLFMKLALKFSNKYDILSASEKKTVYKTAGINSIGPSIAIFFLAIGLIATVGSPMTLMRVGVVGSAHFENYAAQQGQDVVKAAYLDAVEENPDLPFESYTAAVWAMTIGGLGFLISALIVTRKLDKARHSLAKGNPRTILAVSSIPPSAIFLVLIGNTFFKRPADHFAYVISSPHLIAALVSGGSMILFLQLAKRIAWLKEWALGFSFILGILAGYLASL